MKNIFKISSLIIIIGLFAACDLYPNWEDYVEYDPTFPLSGEYVVKNYDIETGEELEEDYTPYSLYIFNKSNNKETGKDSIWIDNRTGHGSSKYPNKFKIKCEANMNNLSFDCSEQGDVVGVNINPVDSAATVSISKSKVTEYSTDITDSKADSITFDVSFSYYDSSDQLVTKKFRIAGHRKTGWENPEYDDDM